jgi:ParB-like chromosome segregation protein Spo0J
MDLFAQPKIIEADSKEVIDRAKNVFELLKLLEFHARVHAINQIRLALHKYSPFANEPVDCVQWIAADNVTANDYNPNSVAPPEMKLLEHSITEDGYTQPIVAWKQESVFEVVDGFHRHRVGRESEIVNKRVMGYLPIVAIQASRQDRNDRIASTIRHNRARGKHKVEAMSDIVVELKRRNWSDEKIGKELGMDADEVLRLCQITGLSEVFANQDFSKAWDIEEPEIISEEILSDISDEQIKKSKRVFHTFDKWECYPSGFYEEKPKDLTQEEGEEKYRVFLSDLNAFETALKEVTGKWKNSCEHYLTNDRMNRIAWLGQASVAQALGIPSCCRGGYNRLTDSEKKAADLLALKYLNIWLTDRGNPELTLDLAASKTEADLY